MKFVPSDVTPATTWPARPIVAELALAERGAARPPAQRASQSCSASMAPFTALRSGDGALLWRRFAGYGDTAPPVPVSGGGVIAADLAGGELWRLDAATGKLAWRLPLSDNVTGVTPLGDDLLATSESGKLFVVNAADGALRRQPGILAADSASLRR